MRTQQVAADSLDAKQLLSALVALKRGNFSVRLPVEWTGIAGKIADTLNDVIELNEKMAKELERVSRVVGKEGKLTQRASLGNVGGSWATLIDSVNILIDDLVQPTSEMARVIGAVANGDLSQTTALEVDGRPLEGRFLSIAKTVNTMVNQLSSFASEVTRVAREVGTEGKLGGQASVPGVAGTWKDLTDNVNMMAANLTSQVRNIAAVTTAVANGDLSRKITVDVEGEMLGLKNTINTMVDQLNSFASEVTRVAREVGTEGKLGGQAQVRGVSGTWKDLTDNVNLMAANLTSQVRGIAKVVTGVANGDLKQKLTVEAKGEIAALADTINGMIGTLATFAEQVTTVAREVGVEGKLGGQASVPGASGTWKDLTDNVNQLAANLTTQMRAIAEVATAVTKGDLTRSIRVEASGEVALLKDNINEMIRNLRDTTQKNSEQDWLKTNLARFTSMVTGQKDLLAVSKLILSELAPLVSAQHGVFYLTDSDKGKPRLKLLATYAYKERKHLGTEFRLGEGLVGECALGKERILLTNVPSNYIQISSGLGEAPPLNIIVLPVLFEGQVKAVIELASFQRFSATHEAFLEQLMESIGIVLNRIEANMRTEELLEKSQSLALQLQSRQEELQQTNAELEEKARLLAEQKAEVERKSQEVEQAKQALEEKAEQLALTSKYKSEFLANMSHELRTPLNSLLILAQQLVENSEGNLMKRQVEFAKTIHAAGSDLRTLINDILDLSKIESGTVTVDVGEVLFTDLRDSIERTFRPVAEAKGLDFTIELDAGLPQGIRTDTKRLQQVLKNLLSNAFKFTERGQVALRMALATEGWSSNHQGFNRAKMVAAFSVSDTGIGISADKQKLIFEAFQQANGSTSRKYGGTGLGLSICREITRLLGGEIRLESAPGKGSTFTLYLPHLSPTPGTRERDSGKDRGNSLVQSDLPSTSPGPRSAASLEGEIGDDSGEIQPGDRMVLIVENDANFARVLLDIVREKGFKGVIALQGATALALARQLKPDAITLDILLPDIDGWTVLDLLKRGPDTHHIPIYVISVEEERERSLRQGAASYLAKPVSKEAVQAVLADAENVTRPRAKKLSVKKDKKDNQAQHSHIVERNGSDHAHGAAEGTGKEAPAARARQAEGRMPDPVHLDMTGPSPSQTHAALAGKKVLIIDDDARTLFALMSTLERYDMEVLSAENGKEGIEILQKTPDVDIVLMDIMMPGMDGYDTIHAIREIDRCKSLPLIAVTAKAMSGDREKCIEAGASDYIPKPVDIEQLLSRLCVAVSAS